MCRYWAVEVERKERGGKARLWLVILKCIWFRIIIQGLLLGSEVSYCACTGLITANLTSLPTPPPPLSGCTPWCVCTQVTLQVCQSVVLGYLADYFTITDPTPTDTRNAYLLAMGTHTFFRQLISSCRNVLYMYACAPFLPLCVVQVWF